MTVKRGTGTTPADSHPTMKSPSRRPRAQPRAQTRHDWAALRSEFVSGPDEALDAFAMRHGIRADMLRQKAGREKWIAQREAFREDVAAKALAARAKNRVASESEIDGRAHGAALKIIDSALAMLDGCDEPVKLKALADTIDKSWRLSRVTARLSEVPVPAPVAPQEVTLILRRKTPAGDVVEFVGGKPNASGDGVGRVGAQADGDAVGVPS